MEDKKYLELLSNQYKNINQVTTEIINLKAIVNLPKGTEHFLSDIHGEFDSFYHVLKNASGVIKMYIEEIFGNSLREDDKKNLATLIYYPEEKLKFIKEKEKNLNDWYKITLFRLVQVCKRATSKYTRSKVRKALPEDFAYILEELIHEDVSRVNKQEYYNEILISIISLRRAESFIIAISTVIQRLIIDHLHIIGDIYDRGYSADKVMDLLCSYHSVDVQWGNHDILWVGAASGCAASICNVVRISTRYNNLHTLEEGYGINLVPLFTFAMDVYNEDDCPSFTAQTKDVDSLSEREISILAKIHKAITILQFKLEGQIIKRQKKFNLMHRLLLDKINYIDGTITIDNVTHKLLETNFPTINPNSPYELTLDEKHLIKKLKSSFINSDKLQKHTKMLMNKGSLYKVFNNNLLFHGCIPMTEDGEFRSFDFLGKEMCGKMLLDNIESTVRNGYFENENSDKKNQGLDLMWYLWCGDGSPLFGKSKMTTFERYFISDKSTWLEPKNPYYKLRNEEEVCIKILGEFSLTKNSAKIINGHVPVEVSNGENPVKANGKLLVIDGGLAKAYQKVTGIAGYTLIYNSNGLILAAHQPFTTLEDVIKNDNDIISKNTYLEHYEHRIKVGDTDTGKLLLEKIEELKELMEAYRNGIIKEKE